MMLHRTWIKSLSSTNNNQPRSSSRTGGKKEISRLANQSAQQPTKEIIRLILNRNKTKTHQNHRQGTPTLALKPKTNKPKQKRKVRTLIRDTILGLYRPIFSARHYALFPSTKRYKPGIRGSQLGGRIPSMVACDFRRYNNQYPAICHEVNVLGRPRRPRCGAKHVW